MDNKYIVIFFIICAVLTLAFVYSREVYDPSEKDGPITQLATFVGVLVLFPILLPALLIAEFTRGWLWDRRKKK